MTRRRFGAAVVLLLALGSRGVAQQSPVSDAAAQPPSTTGSAPVPVVVGSKPFGESYLLAEASAQLLESRGIAVTRRLGLGGTEIAFPALQQGAIDLYPEYTGSGLRVILKESGRFDPAEVLDRVTQAFAERDDLRWLPPLGFENTYAISVRTEMAERLGLRTLSDLGRVGHELRAGFTADFIGLPDGLPGLREAYGFNPREVAPLAPAVKYQALVSGAVDVIDAYSTDGLLARYPLTVLADDRRFFPPYDAALLMRGTVARARPEVVAALTELSGRIDVHRMRRLNERLEVAGEDVARVAADLLAELGLTDRRVPGAAEPSTAPSSSWLAYAWDRRAPLAAQAGRHLVLSATSLTLAIAVALPLGLVIAGTRAAEGVIRCVGLLQTVPGLALLALLIPLLGIGSVPAVLALFLYSLYPIVRNTCTGVQEAGSEAAAAALAMGMTPGQVLRFVRLPLAAPVILAGIRTAAVVNVGTATLAALIGGGGLGEPIVAGLALSDMRMVLSGAIPAALLAVAVDWALARVQRLTTPRGLRVS